MFSSDDLMNALVGNPKHAGKLALRLTRFNAGKNDAVALTGREFRVKRLRDSTKAF